MNPLIDVNALNDEQLLEKMNDLYTKMNAASYLNQVQMLHQLQIAYQMFSEEFNRRQTVVWERQKAKFQESMKIEKKPRVRRNHRERPSLGET